MLRGLDARIGSTDGDPLIIKVAGREPLDATVTVYVDESASGDQRKRRDAVLEEVDRLEAAGVVESIAVRTWQDSDAAACYDEFVAAVGTDGLEPHFEELAGGDAVDVPCLCVAIRDGERLTGLYPRQKNGTDQYVEDCLRALASGDRVENVA